MRAAAEEFERWWTSIGDYRGRLMESAEAEPGYTGAQVVVEARELLIYGVGEPSPALAAVMADAPAGLRVRWRPAERTLAELTAEVRRLLRVHAGRLNSGGPAVDGTRLNLTTTDQEILGAEDPTTLLGSRYPVHVAYREPPVAC